MTAQPNVLEFSLTPPARKYAHGREGGELLAAVEAVIRQYKFQILGGLKVVITLEQEPGEGHQELADAAVQRAGLWLRDSKEKPLIFLVDC